MDACNDKLTCKCCGLPVNDWEMDWLNGGVCDKCVDKSPRMSDYEREQDRKCGAYYNSMEYRAFLNRL